MEKRKEKSEGNYRIIKTNKGTYKVQQKVWIGWRTVGMLTEMGELDMTFDTIQEAEDFITRARPEEIEEIVGYY